MECCSLFQNALICHLVILPSIHGQGFSGGRVHYNGLRCKVSFFFFFYFMIQHSQFGSKSLQNVTFSIESEKSLERKLIEETTIILKQKHMFSTNNLQQVILLNKYSSLIEAALSTTTSGYIICQKQQLKTISTLVKEKNGCMLSHG